MLRVVPGAGIEPARTQCPRDFKSLVSTNFTTRAFGILKRQLLALTSKQNSTIVARRQNNMASRIITITSKIRTEHYRITEFMEAGVGIEPA